MFKSIRVFLSSTFIDMQEERDYLNRVIFPKFTIECQKRGVDFYPIDLRWGITESQSIDNKTIYFCLKQVDYALPFFIGFVGNRYGWIPDNLNYLLDSYPHILEHIGKSATEIEILHYFHKSKDSNASLFLLKDDKLCNQEYADKDNISKLKELKKSLKNNKSTFEYNSIEKMGDIVFNKLMEWLDIKYPLVSINDSINQYKEKAQKFYYSIKETHKKLEQEDEEVRENVYKYAGVDYFGIESIEKINVYKNRVLCLNESQGNSMFINSLLLQTYNEDRCIYVFLDASRELQNPYILKCYLISEMAKIHPEIILDQDYSNLPYTYENSIKVQFMLLKILSGLKLKKKTTIYITNLDLIDKDNFDYYLNFIPSFLTENISIVLTSADKNQFKYLLDERFYITKNFSININFKSEYVGYVLAYLQNYGKNVEIEQINKLYNYNFLSSYDNCNLLCKFLINYVIHNELDSVLNSLVNNKDKNLTSSIASHVFKNIDEDNKKIIKYMLWVVSELELKDASLYLLVTKRFNLNRIDYVKIFEKVSLFLTSTSNGYKIINNEIYEYFNINEEYFDENLYHFYLENIDNNNDSVAYLYSLIKKLIKYEKIDLIYNLISNEDMLFKLIEIDHHLVLIIWEYLFKNNRFNIKEMYPDFFKYNNLSKHGLSKYDYLMKLESSLGYSDEIECFLDIPYRYSTDVDIRHDVYLEELGKFTKRAAKAINEDSEDEKILEAINYSAMLCNYRILNYCLNIYNKKHHGKYDYLNDFKILEFKNYKV